MEERRRLGCSGSGGDNGNHNVGGKEAGMLMLWWVRVVGFLSLIWAGCWVTQFPQNNRAWSKAPCTIWAWRNNWRRLWESLLKVILLCHPRGIPPRGISSKSMSNRKRPRMEARRDSSRGSEAR
ncbi:hypothetical protein ACLB2K_020345 [Fragaria x ananassa]